MPDIGVFEIIYIMGAAILFLHFHARTRQMMMAFKAVACTMCGIYFWGIGADTAMMASLIAGFGCFLQSVFPDRLLARTRILRSGIGVVMAVAALCLAANNTLEAMPLIATIIARFSEVQSCKQRIRLGWVLSQLMWVSYAMLSGLTIMYVVENLNLLSNLKAIWTHEQHRKKAVPAVAQAA